MSTLSAPPSFTSRFYRKLLRQVTNLRRERLRSKVAFSESSPQAEWDLPFSPHILVCHADILLAICTAKAANLAFSIALPWVFHDDGTLTRADCAHLERHFPGSRVITRCESDEVYASHYSAFPSLQQMRNRHVLLLKLADLYVFSRHERILYCDSDILFFRENGTLRRLLDSRGPNYFNRDIATAYICAPEQIHELTGALPLDRVNSGLSVLNRSDISIAKISALLPQLDSRRRTDWTFYNHLIEQTMVAILTSSSPYGARHLPPDYDLRFDTAVEQVAIRHYVGKIRQLYELEGLNHLVSKMSFFERWTEFAHRN